MSVWPLSPIVCLLPLLLLSSMTPDPSSPRTPHSQQTKVKQAQGSFDVSLEMAPEDNPPGGFGRMSIAKTFQGDLRGTSEGVMLAARTAVEGSAGYVALERVTAELEGRKGSFVLQHSGVMGGGQEKLDIQILTDSGTDQLRGIAGSMTIVNNKGEHSYRLLYSLPQDE